MTRLTPDVLVIGAGSGGLSVAAGAAQMGARVVLLEGGKMGGDCLNYGCVPSKALISSAKNAYLQRGAASFGVGVAPGEVDFSAVKSHIADAISQIAPMDSQERFEGLGVHVIREFGHFISPREVQAGEYVIAARRTVIATGASPAIRSIPGLEDVPYETNETIFDLNEKPKHLLVLGGGPVGLEMAQAFARLGSRVTVIEADVVLPREDPELVEVLIPVLRGEQIEIKSGFQISDMKNKNNNINVKHKDGSTVQGSHLLLAVGRKPNTGTLNLEAAGIEVSSTGIKVDETLRTSNRRVYAIGDVAGGMQFTHLAGYHAGVVIRSMLFGLPSKASTLHIPRTIYTDPEISQVGWSEAEARRKFGDRLEVIRFNYQHNDRAVTDRKTTGFIKVMVVKGRPVGASIVGHQAGELISLWSLALANKLKMSQIASMVTPYPTFAELNKRVAGAYFSPRLFDSVPVKRFVRFVQRLIP